MEGVITTDKRPIWGHKIAQGSLSKQLYNFALAKTLDLERVEDSSRAESALPNLAKMDRVDRVDGSRRVYKTTKDLLYFSSL